MTTEEDIHVWYAAYGSNLSWRRFRCYLCGGRPPHAQPDFEGNKGFKAGRVERVESKMMEIPHRLYFALPGGAQGTKAWGPGGVAFIYPERDENEGTICRIWKLTLNQYASVKTQEGPSYRREVRLGYEEDCPVVTVTHPEHLKRLDAPSWAYLMTIAEGLRETHGLQGREIDNSTIAAYLAEKPGIEGKYGRDEIEAYLADRKNGAEEGEQR